MNRRYYNNKSSNESVKAIKYYFYTFFLRVSFLVFIILSIISINLSFSNKNFDNFLRNKIFFTFKPFYVVAEAPFNLLFDLGRSIKNILLTNSTNKRLLEENIILKDLYAKSLDTKKENENLKSILNYVDSFKNEYNYITSKIYWEPKNSIANAVILNVGTKNNIKEGDLILGINKNVIGRVVNVSDTNTKVLLLSDVNSNIPARTVNTGEKFILSGTNSNFLEISHYNSKNPEIVDGDLVLTSGDSDIIPDGIPIGKIKKENGKIKVIMNENANTVFNVLVITKIE